MERRGVPRSKTVRPKANKSSKIEGFLPPFSNRTKKEVITKIIHDLLKSTHREDRFLGYKCVENLCNLKHEEEVNYSTGYNYWRPNPGLISIVNYFIDTINKNLRECTNKYIEFKDEKSKSFFKEEILAIVRALKLVFSVIDKDESEEEVTKALCNLVQISACDDLEILQLMAYSIVIYKLEESIINSVFEIVIDKCNNQLQNEYDKEYVKTLSWILYPSPIATILKYSDTLFQILNITAENDINQAILFGRAFVEPLMMAEIPEANEIFTQISEIGESEYGKSKVKKFHSKWNDLWENSEGKIRKESVHFAKYWWHERGVRYLLFDEILKWMIPILSSSSESLLYRLHCYVGSKMSYKDGTHYYWNWYDLPLDLQKKRKSKKANIQKKHDSELKERIHDGFIDLN